MLKTIGSMNLLGLSTTSYDCNIQQLAAICNFYCGEFYKLIIDENIMLKEENGTQSYIIECESNYIESMEKFYGIKLLKVKDYDEITFEDNKIYYAYIDVKKYPFCANVNQNEVKIHAIILYGQIGNKYLIYDNYYGIKDFKMEKIKVKDALINVWEVEKRDLINSQVTINEKICLKNYLKDIYKIVEKIYCMLREKKVSESFFQSLVDNINILFSYINRCACITKNICNDDLFLKSCSEYLQLIAEKLRSKWYSIYKYKIKHGQIDQPELCKKYKEILNILVNERNIKNEIFKLINNQYSVKERLINQLNKYLNCTADINESVYKRHNGYTILEFINYMEVENHLQEVDTLVFTAKTTYKDFLLVFYKEILFSKV